METLSSYNLIIGASAIVIISFWFNGISKKTNIPSVLMLIVLGIALQFGLKYFMVGEIDFGQKLRGTLEIIGTVGLIMIVLEAALELELKREKLVPILKSMAIALIALIGSAWVATLILYQFIDGMTMQSACCTRPHFPYFQVPSLYLALAGSGTIKRNSISTKVRSPILWAL